MHRTSNYNGWNSLRSDFIKTWEQICAIAQEISAQRVGVRFINKLNEKTTDHALQFWLKPSSYYPEILLSSHTGFFFRGQWASNHNTENARVTIVTIAEGGAGDERDRPLMFDIDIVQTCHAKDQNSLSNLASELHEEIWNIFSNSISDNYLKILNKEN